MKKRILIGLVIYIAILGYFYPNREGDELKKSVEIEKITKPDKNITVLTERKINQKPTVEAGDDQNITFGEEVTLEAIAKDRDGDIVSYLWREGNTTLSEDKSFDYKFDKGVHNIQVVVRDNKGAEAEDNITLNVGIWVLDRVEVNNKSTVCGVFDGYIEYEYNGDDKITKVMRDYDRDGIANEIYYYGYDKEGRDSFEAMDFNNDGVIDRNRSKTFYSNGKIKESTFVQYRDNGTLLSISKDVYAQDGQIVKESYNENVKEYHYNENNQLLEIVNISNNGEYIERKYNYNYDNQLLEVVSMDNEGREVIDEKYLYMDEKLLLREKFYEGKLYSQVYYSYEEEHLKEEKHISYDDENISYTISQYYNKKGLLEKEGETKYLYDEHNRVIVEENDKQKYLYFYNNKGNKIRDERYDKNEDGEFRKQWYTLYNGDKQETIFSNRNGSVIRDSFSSKRHISGMILINQKREVYDEHKNLIEIWDDASDKLIEKRFYRFVYKRKERPNLIPFHGLYGG